MRRVLIIGPGGSGKSTFARRLAERTGLPLHHLDALYWHAGWVPTPNEEWDRVVERLLGGDAWIIDGNYGRTLPTRLAACDTVVFLDLPRLTCMWRLLKRRVEFAGRQRPDLPEACPERLSWEFLLWVWDYPRRRRPAIMERLRAVADRKRVVVLRDQADIERFLASLPVTPREASVDRE
jgi:adenylate kinase family enzyme